MLWHMVRSTMLCRSPYATNLYHCSVSLANGDCPQASGNSSKVPFCGEGERPQVPRYLRRWEREEGQPSAHHLFFVWWYPFVTPTRFHPMEHHHLPCVYMLCAT